MSSKDITTRTGLKKSDAATMGLRDTGSSTDVRNRPTTSKIGATAVHTGTGPQGTRSRPGSSGPSRPGAVRGVGLPAKGGISRQGGPTTGKGKPRVGIAPPSGPPKKVAEPMRLSDALNTEFIYYNSALKLLMPTLSNPTDRQLITPWLEKLYSPVYNTSSLKEKRNRFLLSLLITILNDEAFGWFKQPPPRAILPDPSEMPVYTPPRCAWECDPTWEEIVASLPADLKRTGCTCGGGCPVIENHVTQQLDDEFKFMLYLIRPYVALFPDPEDQVKISQWIQMLCCITRDACVMMKGIRNDYITALFGFAHNLQLAGPFENYPNFDEKLTSFIEAINELDNKPAFMDPTGTEAEHFLNTVPIPDEGAFCYIALTGDLISSEMQT